MIWTILTWIGVGLSLLIGILALMGLFVWATWFRLPRISAAVSKAAFHVSAFGRNIADSMATVAAAPFVAASVRLERLRQWAKNHHRLALVRLDQLDTS